MLTVLREEHILEVRFAADDVDETVRGRCRDDGADRSAHAHPDRVPVELDIAHARQLAEQRGRDRRAERQLHMVEGQPPDGLDAVHLDQPALTDDRHPIARPIHLVDDVRRQEDGPPVGTRLADKLEERLLDERVEAHRRLVEDEQVRPVLERHDKPDLLLVALAVFLELAAWVQIQALDEAVDVGPVHPAPQVAEVGDRLGARQAVVQVELTGQIPDAPVDGDRVDGRLDAEDHRPAGGWPDQVQQDPHRRRLAGAVGAKEAEDLAFGDVEVQFRDAPMGAIGLGQSLDLDDGGHRVLTARWAASAAGRRRRAGRPRLGP